MAEQALLSEEIKEKWAGHIVAEGCEEIKDATIRNNTIRLLENTEKAQLDEATNSTNMTGFDPVILSMVRRVMPTLVANDILGVQPMSGPTGLVFAMKAHYTGDAATGPEAFTEAMPNAAFAAKQTTAAAEQLGSGSAVTEAGVAGTVTPVAQSNPWPEMSMEIVKQPVTADSRALKAKYTTELAQDLKAIHGLDAETELANILSGEVVAEMNREIVALIETQAVAGASLATVAGTFDLTADADGRWSVERYKGLLIQINREAGLIATQSRRGLGNFIITSTNVVAALDMASSIDTSLVSGNLGADGVGVSFVGVLAGRFRVYIDPYMTVDKIILGYKGKTQYDSGLYYCPYVPLQMMKAVGEDDFQPRIGMKTRYATTHNPFVSGTAGQNIFYRTFLVTGM